MLGAIFWAEGCEVHDQLSSSVRPRENIGLYNVHQHVVLTSIKKDIGSPDIERFCGNSGSRSSGAGVPIDG